VPAEADFFTGKLLTSTAGAATTVRQVAYGQPQTIRVDSTAGFSEGDECWYHDVRPGDTVGIFTHATLTRTGAGRYRLEANVPVSIEAVGTISWRTGEGPWQPTTEQIPAGTVELRIVR
jgi:hypothetical protein